MVMKIKSFNKQKKDQTDECSGSNNLDDEWQSLVYESLCFSDTNRTVCHITSCVLHDSFFSKQTKHKKLKEKVVQDQQKFVLNVTKCSVATQDKNKTKH